MAVHKRAMPALNQGVPRVDWLESKAAMPADPKPPYAPSRRAALAACAGLGLSVGPRAEVRAASATLTMVNTVYPPFVNAPNHPLGEGMDVALAREALQRLGLGLRLELVPWRRVLLMLRNGHADLTTTISRREDREAYLHFSVPYRLGANYRFYTRRDSPLQIASLADLSQLRLGVIEGFHYPPTLMTQPGVQRVPGRDIGSLVAMLMANRTDCAVVTAIAGAWEIRERGLEPKLRRQPYEYVSDSPNYMAFAKARWPVDTVKSVSEALLQMAKDGTQARIEKHYLG